jgi:protein-S-isoprenylcysteine O-methyltransferase Ste14
MGGVVPSTERSATHDLRRGISRRAMQVVGLVLFLAVILFGSAGTLDWPWAWGFLGLYLAGIVVNAVLLLWRSPATIAQRSEGAGQVGWDRLVGGLWAVTGFVCIPLVAGLDWRYARGVKMLAAGQCLGAACFVAGLALFSWAMVTNAFFSTVVRVQQDRGHRVCGEGPYRVVRHPGYLGGIVQWLGVPLLLGSWWALLPAVASAALLILRTALEDRTLLTALDGYADYAARVRYRLAPGVW